MSAQRTFSLLRHYTRRLRESPDQGLKKAATTIIGIAKYNMLYLIARCTRRRGKKVLLFLPEYPRYVFAMYKICHILGYRVIHQRRSGIDVAVHWDSGTSFSEDPFAGLSLENVSTINRHCNDISKKIVDKHFTEVFGYSATVDPTTYHGLCVRKSDLNSRHDGEVIVCPIQSYDDDHIYQLLIDNEIEDGMVLDLRAPIFGNCIPFVYAKVRPVRTRFSNTNHHVELREMGAVFSKDEREKIVQFCARMHVEYGEMDILRDKETGRIYIVDIAITPAGPPNHISRRDANRAVARMSRCFEHLIMQ